MTQLDKTCIQQQTQPALQSWPRKHGFPGNPRSCKRLLRLAMVRKPKPVCVMTRLEVVTVPGGETNRGRRMEWSRDEREESEHVCGQRKTQDELDVDMGRAPEGYFGSRKQLCAFRQQGSRPNVTGMGSEWSQSGRVEGVENWTKRLWAKIVMK